MTGRHSAVRREPQRRSVAGSCCRSFAGLRLVVVTIAAQDDSWESMVPAEVAELIKRRAFFGYVKPGREDPE